MFDTTDLTRQLLTAACRRTDAPRDDQASELLLAVADDAAASPTVGDVVQRLAIVAARALVLAAQWSGHDRDELLAEALRCVGDDAAGS